MSERKILERLIEATIWRHKYAPNAKTKSGLSRIRKTERLAHALVWHGRDGGDDGGQCQTP